MGPLFWLPTRGRGSAVAAGAAPPTGQPQITQVDFTGLTGSNFVTAGAGLGYLQYVGVQPQGIWFNTGTEMQPDFSSHGVGNYIPVNINAVDNADGLAADLMSALNLSGTGNWTATHDAFTGKCVITDNVNQVDTAAVDINTGAAITVLQEGHP